MPASKDKGKDKEAAGPIERYLIHRANEAAVAEKPSLWDNLLRDLLPQDKMKRLKVGMCEYDRRELRRRRQIQK